jgi:hypothetical protein
VSQNVDWYTTCVLSLYPWSARAAVKPSGTRKAAARVTTFTMAPALVAAQAGWLGVLCRLS